MKKIKLTWDWQRIEIPNLKNITLFTSKPFNIRYIPNTMYYPPSGIMIGHDKKTVLSWGNEIPAINGVAIELRSDTDLEISYEIWQEG